MKFTGITSEYRQTDEYKQLYSYIMAECPTMTPYLAQMGIHMHKADPEYYKKETKSRGMQNEILSQSRISPILY